MSHVSRQLYFTKLPKRNEISCRFVSNRDLICVISFRFVSSKIAKQGFSFRFVSKKIGTGVISFRFVSNVPRKPAFRFVSFRTQKTSFRTTLDTRKPHSQFETCRRHSSSSKLIYTWRGDNKNSSRLNHFF